MSVLTTSIDEMCSLIWRCLVQVEELVRPIGSNSSITTMNHHRQYAVSSKIGDEINHQMSLLSTGSHLSDICPEVVASGVAIYLGCVDSRGAAVVYIPCRYLLWQSRDLNPLNVAKLILYYSMLASDVTRRNKGLTLIADVRGTNELVLGCLMDTLRHIEARLCSDNVIHIAHIIADREAMQTLLLGSPTIGRYQSNLKLDMYLVLALTSSKLELNKMQLDFLTSVDALYQFIDRPSLPTELGGEKICLHSAWIYFRQSLEQFLDLCQHAAIVLLRTSWTLVTSSSCVAPFQTVVEGRAAIRQYTDSLRSVQTDAHIQGLRLDQVANETCLETVLSAGSQLTDRKDVTEALEDATRLYRQVRSGYERLVGVFNDELMTLSYRLRIEELKENSHQQISVLQSRMVEMELRFRVGELLSNDRLQDIIHIKEDFDQFHCIVMMDILKSQECLNEGHQFIQTSCSSSTPMLSVTVDRDICDDVTSTLEKLKLKISELEFKLDDVKSTISLIVQCYELLNQLYVWTVDTTQFVANMRLDNITLDGMSSSRIVSNIEFLLTSLDDYLEQHPPVSPEVQKNIVEQCQRRECSLLLNKLRTAVLNCESAIDLVTTRQMMLRKAKEQNLSNAELRNPFVCGQRVVLRPGSRAAAKFESPLSGSCSSLDERLACLRRRSYAGKPSNPVCSTFKRRDVDIQEYEEFLLSEGLITDDMSERIVTSLPKCLSDSTMRISRESLRSSRESVQGSQESLLLPAASCETLLSDSAVHRRRTAAPSGSGCTFRSRWRNFKRAVGRLVDGDDSVTSRATNCSVESCDKNGENDYVRSEVTPSWSPVSVTSSFTYNGDSVSHGVPLDDSTRRLRLQSLVIREMVQTERDYINSLRFIIDNYIPELSSDDVIQPLRGKRGVIFGNIEKIYEFHQQSFLAELEACQANSLHIADAFLRHASDFYLYATYSKNKPKSDNLMAECGVSFFKRKQLELGDRMDLSSYLLKPIQRMGKYALLLEQIIKDCTEHDPEYNDLKEALDMVRFQLRQGNDLLAMDLIQECDVNLCEQGMLLRQDEFVVFHGRRKCIRRVFLFEEMILFSKPSKSRISGVENYIYKNSMKTSDLGLTASVSHGNGAVCGDGNDRKFEVWFRRQAPGVTFVLQAPSMEVKQAWLTDLSCLLWRQAIRNRERRRSEMSQMTGNVDLSINERFVSIKLANTNRAPPPRFRNSIAVSSWEHFRSGNKRPHSLVSIGSDSSSSSGGSQLLTAGNSVLPPVTSTVKSPLESYQSIVSAASSVTSSSALTYAMTSCSSDVMAPSAGVQLLATPSADNLIRGQEISANHTTFRRPANKFYATSVMTTKPLTSSSSLHYTDDLGVPCSDM